MDKVVHFEIPTKNIKRAKKFYGDIFGWHTHDMPEMNYTIVHTAKTSKTGMLQEKGAINGGLTTKDSTAKGPVLVIEIPSIDKYVNKIRKAGGKLVMKKSQVGEMGYYARVRDTEGNVIGIWEDIKR
jgi:predicted enzyme related to lactoylglutathione lyase